MSAIQLTRSLYDVAITNYRRIVHYIEMQTCTGVQTYQKNHKPDDVV